MIFKKKEFFLLIFLIFLQSCSGGRIGNFLESSFNDLEKTIQNENLQNNFVNNKILEKENKEIDDKKNKKIKKVEKQKNVLVNKKDTNLEKESKEINGIKDKKIKKVEKQKNDLVNKKDTILEKENKEIDDKKNKKIKKSTRKRNIDLQSYKIIFILKDVDPKDPTEELSSILSNSEVNFEIEKIERILDSKNKSMNKN
ncbi:hypothetical protein CUB78_02195 [Prochlorococcus marinus str. XMU1401]|uniref:Lipoprotein n=1 Tax=Prochlorococcus marinus str. XMU1401 TaxID=2052594 RepID=A0A8I1X1Z8_PROMR|nr:hypothetical protein [Prochlorococcus marinus]MBO8222328.1 hypothetical protein [Prochlorococcus marinus str. XMU1401]MBW3060702.1 hypothetical protein [Prochlorococcus marinus str. XMU1401E]MCQ9198028.1 hypothetical protein [Prochlorococcus marinus XMU1429]PJC84819.1 hypothetical protein CUB78_02195 [Prochlorococcus marinus str. XMU1401]